MTTTRRTPGRAIGLATALVAGTALMAAALAAPAPAAAQTIAITGGTVYPVSGPRLEGATVLIRDGKIVAVGTNVRVPERARRIDAAGKVVTPGLMDASTTLGLVEVGAVGATRDFALQSEDPVTAAFDVVDGINPASTLIPINRLGGVTTALTAPRGGLISGQGAVIDLAGATVEAMLVEPRAAMMASYGAGAASAVGGARGEASLRLREALDDARFWKKHQGAFDRGASRSLVESRLDLEALQPVLAGTMPLVVSVDRASDISAVLRIANDYGLRLVITGGAEAWRVAGELARAHVPVVLDPLTDAPTDFSHLGARFDNAALLQKAGVPVIISTFDAHNVRNLAFDAGNAVRFGLPWDAALRAVTLEPARAFGIDDRYGSLEPGKVADVVVWSGDPFELSSAPETVIIRGRVMPDRSRQRELLERYRTLRADQPPEYRGGEGGNGADGG
ncbi:MAG: amidohydrolase family protein [Candidatus Palauibacterales bacterium]|nr:amidohydrolase family protein [Candidatus Palauibacterales bacterium]MDP2583567.1 amidohydrolase family protein [Candidatus Palauibacterales bacterium]